MENVEALNEKELEAVSGGKGNINTTSLTDIANTVVRSDERDLALECTLRVGLVSRKGIVILYHSFYFYKICILSLFPVAYRVVADGVVKPA